MSVQTFFLGFLSGIIISSSVAAFLFIRFRSQLEARVSISKEDEAKEQAALTQQLKESFDSLSHKALEKNTQSLLNITQELFKKQKEAHNQQLTHKKELIDQRLEVLNKSLTQLTTNVQSLEKERAKTYANLQAQLKNSHEQASALMHSTTKLHELLSNSKRRGQWGERMAEDVLRLTGLKEGVNYVKQKAFGQAEGNNRAIPDFTFILPNGVKVNMDVKFPLANYLHFMDAKSDIERAQARALLLKDVRLRIKEVATKAYINEETVDYVLIFIPNEQVYGFMNEQDTDLLEEALSKKVVFCSPLTLYAMLSIIDRASKDFIREKRAEDILLILKQFRGQWDKFNEVLSKMGRRLEDALREFQLLTTTRKTQLERPLQKLDELQKAPELKEGSPLETPLGDATLLDKERVEKDRVEQKTDLPFGSPF